jgi:hypothetical protein
MKKAMPFVVLFLALALANCPPAFAQGAAGSAPAVAAQSGPKAEVPEKVHNFGELKDTEYSYGFVVRNVGTAPLEIKRVIKICGTEVGQFDHTIAPGSQVTIPISLNSSSCNKGDVKKSVLFLTNDSAASFVLSLTGHISR